jgi:hypothetical protein
MAVVGDPQHWHGKPMNSGGPMAEPDIFCDDIAFGQVAGIMVQVGERIQDAATALGSAVAGELGPPALEEGASAAAHIWAAGAGKLAADAQFIANKISEEIASYTNMDQLAQARFLQAIAGEHAIDCTHEVPDTK